MIRRAILTAAALLLAAGCSSGDPGSGTDGDSPPIGDLGDAVEVMAGAPDAADSGACDVERRTLETAVEAYILLVGAEPTEQSELVDEGLLKEASPRYELTTGGTIVPAEGSPCT